MYFKSYDLNQSYDVTVQTTAWDSIPTLKMFALSVGTNYQSIVLCIGQKLGATSGYYTAMLRDGTVKFHYNAGSGWSSKEL